MTGRGSSVTGSWPLPATHTRFSARLVDPRRFAILSAGDRIATRLAAPTPGSRRTRPRRARRGSRSARPRSSSSGGGNSSRGTPRAASISRRGQHREVAQHAEPVAARDADRGSGRARHRSRARAARRPRRSSRAPRGSSRECSRGGPRAAVAASTRWVGWVGFSVGAAARQASRRRRAPTFAGPFTRFHGRCRDGRGGEVEHGHAGIGISVTTTSENPTGDRVELRVEFGRGGLLPSGCGRLPLCEGGVLDRRLAQREVVAAALAS